MWVDMVVLRRRREEVCKQCGGLGNYVVRMDPVKRLKYRSIYMTLCSDCMEKVLRADPDLITEIYPIIYEEVKE